MKFSVIIPVLVGILINVTATGQRRLPPPPPRTSKVVINASSNNATTKTENKNVTSTTQKTVVESKEWRQVIKTNIYSNTDSSLLIYQTLKEQKSNTEKNIENEYKSLNASFVKKSFETTVDFEARKTKAINELKSKRFELLSPIVLALSKFEGAVYLSKTNRFKYLFSDKDYDADAQLWKFKIIDIITNNMDFVYLKIKPSEAEKLWDRRDEIKLQQVMDYANPRALYVCLTYPNQENVSPIVFSYLEKKRRNEFEEMGEDANPAPKESSLEDPLASTEEETNKIFTSVQIQSTFPGGSEAWVKFLSRTLNRDLPVENGAPAGRYAVTVSFVVARDGSISDVKAENDPGYGTAAEAVRVIKKGPNWTPAQQNGRNVIYRHRQAIVFQVSED